MARDSREPQSYGSGSDWVTGKTGQEIRPEAPPSDEQREFYESSRESDQGPDQGGKTSPVQAAESETAAGGFDRESSAVPKVTAETGGAKRGSFFRKRDYE